MFKYYAGVNHEPLALAGFYPTGKSTSTINNVYEELNKTLFVLLHHYWRGFLTGPTVNTNTYSLLIIILVND